jgi:hypothetical protein
MIDKNVKLLDVFKIKKFYPKPNYYGKELKQLESHSEIIVQIVGSKGEIEIYLSENGEQLIFKNCILMNGLEIISSFFETWNGEYKYEKTTRETMLNSFKVL